MRVFGHHKNVVGWVGEDPEESNKSNLGNIIYRRSLEWGELGGRGGREVCSKDSDWMLGEALGKHYLERLWSLSQWRSCWRRLGKPFSEATMAVDSALEQTDWQDDFLTLWGSLPVLPFVDKVRMNTGPPLALRCNSSNWLHWSFCFVTAQ